MVKEHFNLHGFALRGSGHVGDEPADPSGFRLAAANQAHKKNRRGGTPESVLPHRFTF